MSTLAQLRALVQAAGQPYSLASAAVDASLNAAILELAALFQLPDLISSSTVTTSTTLAYVAMPSGVGNVYHRHLFHVYSAATEAEVGNIYKQKSILLNKYPGLDDTGDVESVCVIGNTLWYNPIPSAADTLTMHYLRKPVDMSGDSDTPDGIPDHLQTTLLVSMAVKKEADKLPQSSKKQLIDFDRHERIIASGMAELVDWCGPEENEPYEVVDETDYIC